MQNPWCSGWWVISTGSLSSKIWYSAGGRTTGLHRREISQMPRAARWLCWISEIGLMEAYLGLLAITALPWSAPCCSTASIQSRWVASLIKLKMSCWLPAAKKTNKFMKILWSSAFCGSVLSFIPWIAALYFVIKTLQASAAQAYTSLLNDQVPEYIVGLITNVSTSYNLKVYGDMMNLPAADLMLAFTAVVLGLLIFCLLFFSWISVDDNELEIAT